MNLERLYLDYNATSPLSESVKSWLRSGDVLFANPASQHTSGKASRKIINETRTQILDTFHRSEKDTKLFFHSGATEGIHTFAYSLSEYARRSGRELLICYSKVDHPATLSLVERYYGPHVRFLELKRDQDLHYRDEENYQNIKAEKEKSPGLVVLYHHLWVHNETGQVAPLEKLAPFKTIDDLYLHIDAVQTPGKIPDWHNLSVGDIWTYSAHKFGALKGIGFSLFKSDVPFHALITGGGQQGALRSGTENIQGVKSIALALDDLQKINVTETQKLRSELEAFFVKELEGIGGVVTDTHMASNTIYFYLNKLSSDIALALFDLQGLQISAGSACSSGAAKDSQVLLQMGLPAIAKNGLRLSMNPAILKEELNKIEDRLTPVFNKLRTL